MHSSPLHRNQVMTLSFLLLIRRLRLAAGRTGQQQKNMQSYSLHHRGFVTWDGTHHPLSKSLMAMGKPIYH